MLWRPRPASTSKISRFRCAYRECDLSLCACSRQLLRAFCALVLIRHGDHQDMHEPSDHSLRASVLQVSGNARLSNPTLLESRSCISQMPMSTTHTSHTNRHDFYVAPAAFYTNHRHQRRGLFPRLLSSQFRLGCTNVQKWTRLTHLLSEL